MRAIVNIAPGKLAWREMPTPEPRAGEVRVRTAACGICATDLEMIDGWARTGFPSVPGHEWSGEVDAAGAGVDASLVGRRCVADNVLADGGEVGFEHPGGYAEHLVTEAKNVRVLPDDFPPATAALIEPLAVCVRALRRLDVKDKHAALVLGDGPIGLIVLMLLKHDGVKDLCLVGGRPTRLALARELV
ncbi:MAG TPA: alcohol dehydrogenase catalytic domain-containing protein, partial [Planctomycetota bacterium]|nr:alcohol dehydrogenase catalytic domain-containing protein [Planctomycetota bacterium]